jgi:hypothetical protein
VKIHPPTTQQKQGKLIVSARVEVEDEAVKIPQQLWYEVPESYAPYLSPNSDAFVAGLIPAAMSIGEDLHIIGALSEKLAYGLYEYINIYHQWFPKWFSKVSVNCENLTTFQPHRDQEVIASSFSGGVDSMYTLWSHLKKSIHNPTYRIRYGLFAHGLDIPLNDHQNYVLAYDEYKQGLDAIGVNLLSVRTNVRQFTEGRVSWLFVHGAPTISCALLLSNLITRFIFASTFTYANIFPWGSSPITDHLLSTESTEIIHYGASKTRVRKIEAFVDFPLAQNHIRVCAKPHLNVRRQNCSQCEKCLRTMVMLEICDGLDKFTAFQKPPLFLMYIRWGVKLSHHSVIWVSHLIQYAKTEKKYHYIPLLWMVRVLGLPRQLLYLFIPKKFRFWLKDKLGLNSRDPFHLSYKDDQPKTHDNSQTRN